MNLVLKANDTAPAYHFTELVKYLQFRPPRRAVYIHSAPAYAILLVGAAIPPDITIIIAPDCPEKTLL